MTDLAAAKSTLLAELREHSLVIGEVTLASGAIAQYYVDARRTLMRPGGFRAAGELIAAAAHELGADAVGGPATAAIPPSCAPLAVAGSEDLVAFFVRGEKKQHGLQRWVEGPVEAGVKALIVEDTVTTGGSTAKAIERCREEGLEIVGVVAVVDRLAGGAEKIEAAAEAPYRALVTIDDSTQSAPTGAEVGAVSVEADAIEIRVVACLVEKQRTTPDAYPLSLNALRNACNQSTNREPVVDYDEQTVSDALRRTALRGWTRLTSGAGSRARKYRHLLPEALSVDDAEVNLLAVLMLRGAQTPGELKLRTERYQGGFADLGAVNEVLERLIDRGFVIRHPRRPGQKEERYEQVLGGDDAVELVPAEPTDARSTLGPAGDARSTPGPLDGPNHDRDLEAGPNDDRAAPAPARPSVADETARLDRLEADLLDLKGEIANLREALGD